MPELPDVISGEPVESNWGNDIRDRTLQRYVDAADRDAAVPLPVSGDLAYLDDVSMVTVSDGALWWPVGGASEILSVNGTVAAAWLTVNGGTASFVIDFQPDVTGVVDGILIPEPYRPSGGPARQVLPSYSSGYGAKAGQFFHVRINIDGTFEIQAFHPDFVAGDRIMGTMSYVIDTRGI